MSSTEKPSDPIPSPPGTDTESLKQSPAPSFHDPGVFPEGGAKAWLSVSGASACLFVSFGWVNCIGIFQDYYQTHQLSAYSPSEIAWIPALQIFFMLFGGVFVGKIFDDYGPAIPLLAGTFLHVFGLMMTSISKTYYQIILSQAICSALGASLVFYPAFNCVSTWFLKKRGAALGLVAAGSSIGGVVLPIMIIHLLPKVGFGWTIRIVAFLILGLLIWANISLKSRLTPNKRPFVFSQFISPLKERTFNLLTASVFFYYWGMFIPLTFIVEEARSHGMSTQLANYLVPILNGASIIGRTVPNILADKYGHFNVMIITTLTTTVLILALWLPATGNAPMTLFAALFGISSGAGIGLTPALCAHISPIQDIGRRTGLLMSISSLAALSGSPIAGRIIQDSLGSFKYAMVFGGVNCFVGTLLFVATRWSLVGRKLAIKI